jgi:hypothetical protein
VLVVAREAGTTPTIDGVMAANEWSGAATLPFMIQLVSRVPSTSRTTGTYLNIGGTVTDLIGADGQTSRAS